MIRYQISELDSVSIHMSAFLSLAIGFLLMLLMWVFALSDNDREWILEKVTPLRKRLRISEME